METEMKEEFSKEAVESELRHVTLKTLLESGAHYGHDSSEWNPKMAPYIYGLKDNTYLIDLDSTVKFWNKAKEAVFNHVSNGGTILFVGRRKRVIPIITGEAIRSGAFYMAGKWPGGTLTNFGTIRGAVHRMLDLEAFVQEAIEGKVNISKRELIWKQKELDKLHLKFNGIREMRSLPGMIFTTHSTFDEIAVSEARTLGITVVGLVDTDSNPDLFDYIIPTNDDAILSLKLFISNMAQTVLEGRLEYELKVQKQAIENQVTAEKFIENELA